jgi:hypothetical protein
MFKWFAFASKDTAPTTDIMVENCCYCSKLGKIAMIMLLVV